MAGHAAIPYLFRNSGSSSTARISDDFTSKDTLISLLWLILRVRRFSSDDPDTLISDQKDTISELSQWCVKALKVAT